MKTQLNFDSFKIPVKGEAVSEEGLSVTDLDPALDNHQVDIGLDQATGQLIAVEDLDVDAIPTGEGTDEPTPGTEDLHSATTGLRQKLNAQVQYLQKLGDAVGMSFLGEMPKPPPSIFQTGEKSVEVHISGSCFTTVMPLIHMLTTANDDETFVLEISSAYLRPQDWMGLISAVQATRATVITNVVQTQNPLSFILGISGKEYNLRSSVHVFGPLQTFSVGTGETVARLGEDFRKHSDMVFGYLLERNVLTEDEVKSIQEKESIFPLTSEEIQKRMGGDTTSE